MSRFSRSYLNRYYFTKHFVFERESPDNEIRYPVTLAEFFKLDSSPSFNIVVFGKYDHDVEKMFGTSKVSVHELTHTELVESIKRWNRRNPLTDAVDTYFFTKIR